MHGIGLEVLGVFLLISLKCVEPLVVFKMTGTARVKAASWEESPLLIMGGGDRWRYARADKGVQVNNHEWRYAWAIMGR